MSSRYKANRPLISIHIPKCGGQSLNHLLSRWYKDKYYVHYRTGPNGVLPEKVKLQGLLGYRRNVCIHGHFNRMHGMGIEDYYPHEKQLITFLRDPLDISISTYFYNQKRLKNGKVFFDGRDSKQARDIDEHLETRQSFITYFLPKDMTPENFKSIMSSRFIHIGIIEEFQKSIDILAYKLKKMNLKIAHINRTAWFDKPSESSIKAFKSKCKFEYAIYNYAKSMVEDY